MRWVHLRGGRTSIDYRGANQLGYSGGLVHVLGTGTTLDARHVIFSRGLACEGGGLYGRHSAALILQDCLLRDNIAQGVSINRVGGGICIEQSSSLALVDSTIIGNHAQGPELAQGIGVTSGFNARSADFHQVFRFIFDPAAEHNSATTMAANTTTEVGAVYVRI